MHPANYVFGSDGITNQTGGWNTGLAFLFGLLSVQWTVRGFAPHYIVYVLIYVVFSDDCKNSASHPLLDVNTSPNVGL